MNLSTEELGDALVIHVDEDRLDAAVAMRFKDKMRDLTLAAQGRVILDLSRVGFMDSSGLGALVAAMKSLPPPARLELAGLQSHVQKVLRLTRMDTVFPIHQTIEHAIGGLHDAG